MDRFGASDAWLMFAIGMTSLGNYGAALVGFGIVTLYSALGFLGEKNDQR